MIGLCLLAAPVCGGAQDASASLHERVKAAYLYKFAGYVDWPAEAFSGPAAAITIGVATTDSLARELEQAVAGRQVAGRPVRIQRLKRGDSPGGCCHILFVGAANDARRTRELIDQAQVRPTLTVTESPSEHPQGSVINFVQVDDRMRFDISREAAERAGLQIRSQLLAVARNVVSP